MDRKKKGEEKRAKLAGLRMHAFYKHRHFHAMTAQCDDAPMMERKRALGFKVRSFTVCSDLAGIGRADFRYGEYSKKACLPSVHVSTPERQSTEKDEKKILDRIFRI